MIHPIVHPDAQKEYDEAVAYYHSVRPDLGTAFMDMVEETFGKIGDHPLAWPILRGRVRRFGTRRFPYSILYIPKDEVFYVVAIMHAKRRPGYWRSRLASFP